MWPKIRPADKSPWYEIAACAFYLAERPTANGNLPSNLVYQQLLDRYKKYAKGNYWAPCTSIVGPSGIGKSFIVQQMAVQRGIYVAYTSFAHKGSGASPGRSAIAGRIFKGPARENFVKFWKTLITVSLMEVEVCRRVGVTPAAMFLPTRSVDRYHSTSSNPWRRDVILHRTGKEPQRRSPYAFSSTGGCFISEGRRKSIQVVEASRWDNDVPSTSSASRI